jgi:hypothetical protein
LIAQVIDRLADAISASGSTDAVPAVFTGIQATVAWCVAADASTNHVVCARRLIVTRFTKQSPVGTIYAGPARHVTALILGTITICCAANATTLFRADAAGSTLGIVLTLQALQRLTVAQLPHRTITFLQTLDALVVQTIANLTTRAAETVLLVALVTALILNAGITSLTRFVVTAAFNTFGVNTDPTITAVGILSAAIFAEAQVFTLGYLAVLTEITLL